MGQGCANYFEPIQLFHGGLKGQHQCRFVHCSSYRFYIPILETLFRPAFLQKRIKRLNL